MFSLPPGDEKLEQKIPPIPSAKLKSGQIFNSELKFTPKAKKLRERGRPGLGHLYFVTSDGNIHVIVAVNLEKKEVKDEEDKSRSQVVKTKLRAELLDEISVIKSKVQFLEEKNHRNNMQSK